MLLGKVTGTVWATQKDPKVDNLKFQIVQEIDKDGSPLDSFVVAADAVGAGDGETVLVAEGSAARQSSHTRRKPIDAVIMAIVDDLSYKEIEALKAEYEDRKQKIDEQISEQMET